MILTLLVTSFLCLDISGWGQCLNLLEKGLLVHITVEPRLSGPRLSGLFLWSQFCHEYLLVMIKICSHILFKTTVFKSEVKASLLHFH